MFLLDFLYSSIRFGFMGNHPRSTRFFCSNTSKMLHRHEHPTTPNTGLRMSFVVKSDVAMKAMPVTPNTHQHRVPKWYSDLITIG